MVALHSRYSGPTDTRGSRIIAHRMDWSPSHRTRVSVEPDDNYSDERAHLPAIRKLCAKFDWHGNLACGGSDSGYVWVWVPMNCPQTDLYHVYEV